MRNRAAGGAAPGLTLDEIRRKSVTASAVTHGYVLMMLVRPFAPALAWVALRMGLTPRQVTCLGLLLTAVIIALAAAGGDAGRRTALLLIIVWELLDVADGTMARATGRRDNFGGFLDYAAGIVLVAFLPLALGIGLATAPDGSLARAAEALGWTWGATPLAPLIAGACMSAIALFVRLVNRVLYLRFGDSYSNWEEPRKSAADLTIRNLETIGGVQGLVLMAAAFAGLLEFALVAYMGFYLLLLAAFAVSTYRAYHGREEYYDVVIRPRTP